MTFTLFEVLEVEFWFLWSSVTPYTFQSSYSSLTLAKKSLCWKASRACLDGCRSQMCNWQPRDNMWPSNLQNVVRPVNLENFQNVLNMKMTICHEFNLICLENTMYKAKLHYMMKAGNVSMKLIAHTCWMDKGYFPFLSNFWLSYWECASVYVIWTSEPKNNTKVASPLSRWMEASRKDVVLHLTLWFLK